MTTPRLIWRPRWSFDTMVCMVRVRAFVVLRIALLFVGEAGGTLTAD